jgi:hypothetical protein
MSSLIQIIDEPISQLLLAELHQQDVPPSSLPVAHDNQRHVSQVAATFYTGNHFAALSPVHPKTEFSFV